MLRGATGSRGWGLHCLKGAVFSEDRKGIVTRKDAGYNQNMTEAKKTENCMVCGERLNYLQAAEAQNCSYCGTAHQAHVRCPKGHFVCDACHGKEARKMIEDTVLASRSEDPVEIAELMMSHPGLPMLSCDHAYIAAGALLAALRNSPYGARFGETEVREVFARIAKQASDGICGLTGVCSIVPAVGAVVALFLDSRPGADREQKLAMEAASRANAVIIDLTGPSCCKAYVRAAVSETAGFFAEKFGIVLPVRKSDVICNYASRHAGCREEKCPHFRRPSRDIFAETGFRPGMISCVT